MSERTPRLLRALQVVSDAGPALEPSWNPHTREGVVYRGTGSALTDASILSDLEELADEDYLERVFVDRLSLCPNCESHALNVREVCMTCTSANLVQIKTLLHFRCGFVGPISAFAEDARGRRCPKCRKLLTDPGTDHDSPGDYFSCRACSAAFQVAEVGARCLSCGARFSGVEMQRVTSRDIFAYRLTALGKAALSEGRLLEGPLEAIQDSSGVLYRRNVLIAHIEDERRRRLGTGTAFGLIVLGAGQNGTRHPIGDDLALSVRNALSGLDKLGRLDDHHLVALLPGASKGQTRTTLKRVLRANRENGASPFRADVVELSDAADIADNLEEAARRIDGP